MMMQCLHTLQNDHHEKSSYPLLSYSATKKFCVCDKKFYSLGNFQIYMMKLLTIVILLYITSQ